MDIKEELVGMSYNDAKKLLKDRGIIKWRLMHYNGEDYVGTADFKPGRLNLIVTDDIVKEVYTG